MFPVWFILGIVMILAGTFNRQILKWLGSRSNSEVFADPLRKRLSRMAEQIGRWLVIALGLSFLVLGLGETLPRAISSVMLFVLLGTAGLMLVAIIGVTVSNWTAK